VLDGAHRGALRAVAQGGASEEHAQAVRNLAVAGLIAPVDGVWTVTQSGHAVLEIEGGAGAAGGGDEGGSSDLMGKVRDWFMS
jgi:hypothetical protein